MIGIDLHQVAILKRFGGDFRADDTGNAKLARDDCGMTGNPAFVGHDMPRLF
jgi:hypothetical protein